MNISSSSFTSLESWLGSRGLSSHLSLLIDAGYESIDEVREVTNEEAAEIVGLFQKPGHKLKMRLLIKDLQQQQPIPNSLLISNQQQSVTSPFNSSSSISPSFVEEEPLNQCQSTKTLPQSDQPSPQDSIQIVLPVTAAPSPILTAPPALFVQANLIIPSDDHMFHSDNEEDDEEQPERDPQSSRQQSFAYPLPNSHHQPHQPSPFKSWQPKLTTLQDDESNVNSPNPIQPTEEVTEEGNNQEKEEDEEVEVQVNTQDNKAITVGNESEDSTDDEEDEELIVKDKEESVPTPGPALVSVEKEVNPVPTVSVTENLTVETAATTAASHPFPDTTDSSSPSPSPSPPYAEVNVEGFNGCAEPSTPAYLAAPPNTAVLSSSQTLVRAQSTPSRAQTSFGNCTPNKSFITGTEEIRLSSLAPPKVTGPALSSSTSTLLTSAGTYNRNSLPAATNLPRDLIELPKRLSIKERLAALQSHQANGNVNANNNDEVSTPVAAPISRLLKVRPAPLISTQESSSNVSKDGEDKQASPSVDQRIVNPTAVTVAAVVSGVDSQSARSGSFQRRSSGEIKEKAAQLANVLTRPAPIITSQSNFHGTDYWRKDQQSNKNGNSTVDSSKRNEVTSVSVPFGSSAPAVPTVASPLPPSCLNDADEFTINLPSVSSLMLSCSLIGPLHHAHLSLSDPPPSSATLYIERNLLLHKDSLYFFDSSSSLTPSFMIKLTSASISIQLQECVLSLTGKHGRHILRAEKLEINDWFEKMKNAKSCYSEERREEITEVTTGERESASINPSAVGASRRKSFPPHEGADLLASVFNKSIKSNQMKQSNLGETSPPLHVNSVTLPVAPAALHYSYSMSTAPVAASSVDSSSVDGSLSVRVDSSHLRSLLVNGSLFTKYKHKRGKLRLIWASAVLDRLYWSDAKSKDKVKGFVLASDLIGVREGIDGVKGEKRNQFTVFTKQRTLELEARDEESKRQWVRAIEMVVNLYQS